MIIELLSLVFAIFFGFVIGSILVLIAPEEMKTFNKWFWVVLSSLFLIYLILVFFSDLGSILTIIFFLVALILISTKRIVLRNKKFLFQTRAKINYISSQEFVNYILKQNKKNKLNLKKTIIAFFKLFSQIFKIKN